MSDASVDARIGFAADFFAQGVDCGVGKLGGLCAAYGPVADQQYRSEKGGGEDGEGSDPGY
jgi:hypothetical protein